MPETRRTTQLPSRCSRFLPVREVLDLGHLAVADHHVGPAGEDRRHQLRDVLAAVLVVGVGVDDHVGAQLQRRIEAGLEGGREPLVVGQPDDVLDPVLARHLDRAVGGAVVDHQPLDLVEAIEARAGGRREWRAGSPPRSGRGSG